MMNTNSDRYIDLSDRPRFLIICGRDWLYGPDTYSFGALWGRYPTVKEGDLVYAHQFVICIQFRMLIRRR